MESPNPIPAIDPAPRDDSWVDEALAPFGVFVEAMSVATTAAISGSEHVPSFWVEKLEIELPFEMDVLVDPDARVRLSGGPPTQYTETTILPVFHQIRLSVSAEVNLAADPEPMHQPGGEEALGGNAEP